MFKRSVTILRYFICYRRRTIFTNKKNTHTPVINQKQYETDFDIGLITNLDVLETILIKTYDDYFS